MGAIEQRKDVRFDVEVSAEIYTKDEVLPAHTRNLSSTGVCLDLQKPLEEASAIGISLFVTSDGIEDPDAEPLNIRAKVIWCTELDTSSYSAGARFDDVNQNTQETLNQLLKDLG